MLKLKLQYFGHLMRRTDSFEKTLMLGKIEGINLSLLQTLMFWYCFWPHCASGTPDTPGSPEGNTEGPGTASSEPLLPS